MCFRKYNHFTLYYLDSVLNSINLLIGRGSSGKKYSETYRGEYPLSEPEARALAGVLKKYRPQIKLYVSLHTYGNCIMYPWGYKCTPVCDEKELVSILIKN